MLGNFFKGFFPNGNFPNVQFPKQQIPNSVLATALDPQAVLVMVLGPLAHPSRSSWPHCSLQRLRVPNLTFGKLQLGKLHIWKVDTWENTLGKFPLLSGNGNNQSRTETFRVGTETVTVGTETIRVG